MLAKAEMTGLEPQALRPTTAEVLVRPVLAKIYEWDIPPEHFVIAGSWCILAAGVSIDRQPGDIDIVPTSEGMQLFLAKGWLSGRHQSTGDFRAYDPDGSAEAAEVWPCPWGKGSFTAAQLRARATIVGGVAFAPLALAIGYKEKRGTFKDLQDLAAIRHQKTRQDASPCCHGGRQRWQPRRPSHGTTARTYRLSPYISKVGHNTGTAL